MRKRALISVSNKSRIASFARALSELGWEILSTGGTEKTLLEAGVSVMSVEAVTEFPECFGGRVKTLHPKIMGGILYRRDDAKHRAEAEKLGIVPINLVVVNLYPFAETIQKSGVTREEAVEQIDIGGPTLLQSAAKNHESVTVVCDPNDYERVLQELRSGGTSLDLRRELAAKVFLHTAAYDAVITEYLSAGKNHGVMMTGGTELRYGENPHQWGRYYRLYGTEDRGQRTGGPLSPVPSPPSLWGYLHQGKPLSYLNILDADSAWAMAQEFADPTAVFVKHANPSGVASHSDINEAFQLAYDTDRLSAFGVIIALNQPCTKVIAQKIIDQKIFVEVLIAPGYEDGALKILEAKPNIRVIEQGGQRPAISDQQPVYRSVSGGMLVQQADGKVITEKDLTCVTEKKPNPEQIEDLLFAWKVVKHTKSNAIVFAKDKVTLGIGSGQTNRVESTWIAAKRAGERAKNAVMASDAFFPFPDAVEEAAKAGISAIIQPGGSIRDSEVFAVANTLGIAMVTTGLRAFRH